MIIQLKAVALVCALAQCNELNVPVLAPQTYIVRLLVTDNEPVESTKASPMLFPEKKNIVFPGCIQVWRSTPDEYG